MKKYIFAITFSIFILIGISVVLFSTINEKIKSDKTDYLPIANQNINDGHFSAAIDNYEMALTRNPDINTAYLNEAQIYVIKNRPDDAIRILKRGLINVTAKSELNLSLGQIYYTQNDYSNASIYLKKYYEVNKTNQVEYELGRISFMSGDYTSARKYFSSINTYKPSLFEISVTDVLNTDLALNDLAAYKAVHGDEVNQMPTWENDLNTVKIAVLNKKSVAIIETLEATALDHANRCELGVPLLLDAIATQEKISPYINARIFLGDCYYKLGKYAEAKQILEQTFALDKSTKEIRQVLALTYSKLGINDKALLMYKELTALDNSNVDFRKSLIEVELTSKLFNDAILDIDQLEKLNTDPIYQFKKASILMNDLQNYKDANIYLTPIVSSLPSSNILDIYGWTQYKLGDKNNGLKYINMAIDKDLKYALSYYHRGLITKDDSKTKTQAKNDFYTAIDLDTTGSTADALTQYNLLN